MLICMDMDTGAQEPRYGEEVLNAGWLPAPELALNLEPAVREARQRETTPPYIDDVDAFLARMYRCQG